MTKSHGSVRSKVGVLVCGLLMCSGCGDDGGGGSGDGGSAGASGNSGGAGSAHLEMELAATTSNSAAIEFHCDLDYTVDIHASAQETEAWVREYLDDSANSVVFSVSFQAILDDESLLSDSITTKMMDGVVGLPGVYGSSVFVATCGDVQLAM